MRSHRPPSALTVPEQIAGMSRKIVNPTPHEACQPSRPFPPLTTVRPVRPVPPAVTARHAPAPVCLRTPPAVTAHHAPAPVCLRARMSEFFCILVFHREKNGIKIF